MRSADMGMNIDRVLGIRNPRLPGDDYVAQRATMISFQNELKSNPHVLQVGYYQ